MTRMKVATLLAMAVFGTIVPAALNYLLVRRVGATRASLAMFLMPLIAVFAGAILLGERLESNAYAGLALIPAGSVLVTRTGPRRPGPDDDVPAAAP